ncbi:TLE family member 4, transcriptional corepressor [Homo sapiens]|uniref:TLE family member 4, transcriptional corepressor n=1 Tax=Homo sapiens TaxID=9606 RepID=E7EQH3_HUMAN|nr:TLE family member 4, transcriptional corepressor [Homo sapiens]KAI4007487.1 TLE family member 4, transcriptional corepressor [Homo sapiens]
MIRDLSKMYPQTRHPAPHQPAQPFKFTISESCDRIKEEFQFLQAQYHSLKLECEKLASEKTEMQRHYVMYYEMSYGLNIEMHKQAEIVKRLNAICAQVIPFLSQEHQQQVVQAVERAKQVTMAELNAIIGQQLQAQHLSHGHGLPVPLTPHPSGLQPPAIPPIGSSAGLLALSSALGGQSHLPIKDEKKHHDNDHQRDRDSIKQNYLLLIMDEIGDQRGRTFWVPVSLNPDFKRHSPAMLVLCASTELFSIPISQFPRC